MFRSYRTKLQAAFVLLALVAIALTGYEASVGASVALEQSTHQRLAAVRDAKQRQLERYFRDIHNHVLALSTDESAIVALEEFGTSWKALGTSGAERMAALHELFLEENPHPAGARELLLKPSGGGRYGQLHARYHPTFHRYRSAFGFYDIFLIDTKGRILYTVVKEADLGGDLESPPLAGTGLSRVFRRAMALPGIEQSVMEDYEPYAVSDHELAAFVAAPIWRAGMKQGVLAIQVSVDEVNRVLDGDGTFEYIVGEEGMLRAGTRAADGVPVLRSSSPIGIPDVAWTLIAELDSRQALAPVRAMRARIAGWGAVVACAFLAAAWWLGRSVTQPVLELAAQARQLGAGDFTVRIPVRSQDELGQLAESFNRMAGDLRDTTVSRDQLDAAHHKLQELTDRLIDSQEQERTRLARELHDDITQRMATIAMEAGRLKHLPGDDAAQWRAGLERLQQQMARLSDDIHGLSRRLHPSTLDDLGLAAAVEGECRGFFERGGPPVDLRVEGELELLSPGLRLALYRIIQESLRNIARHAEANEVTLDLRRAGQRVLLDIRDDGRGFDRQGAGWRAGIGLASMAERIRSVGGTFTVDSVPGKGTRISVEAPV
ncbi:MAG: HAMP domain-containing protein [Acidobacteria bacterium]|nr:HAMP domain-containing protein [Acidobacteriota bacterium]